MLVITWLLINGFLRVVNLNSPSGVFVSREVFSIHNYRVFMQAGIMTKKINHRANGWKSIYLRVTDAIIDLPWSVQKRNVQPVLMQRITSSLLILWNFICITFVIYCLYEIVYMFLQMLWFKMWQNVLFRCCKLNKKWETFKYLNSYFEIYHGNRSLLKLWNKYFLGSSDNPDVITNFENLFKYVH